MSIESVGLWLVIGAAAGWLASFIMRQGGLSITGRPLIDTILTGIVGAFIGGWLLNTFGVSIGSGLTGSVISAAIGACVLLFVLGLFRR
jgi:uncharacterized membrane protein YeaQ/YmgE (transglycosylase-associated protein family)